MSERYQQSEAMLERALRCIPLGAQTFSQSVAQFPHGVSPYFLEKGRGCRVMDPDGNKYIDFIMGLAAVTLGYGDPEVNAAIRHQLNDGVIFSLPHRLEAEVAEQIVAMVPCAEMVRFAKNGSDATAGAIRLARAYTGRDNVAVCGYHGWQDWYIGATARHRGVPTAVRELTHSFPYNDLEALADLLASHPDGFAAVILEPMNMTSPAPGYLEGVQALAHRYGALLIFDECVTGFRFEKGGAQERFGVVPDLVAFGKGMANGLPLSAIAGPREIMRLMEEIFFSFTFGGELLSLAAAKATLDKLQTQPVIEHLKRMGERIQAGIAARIAYHELSEVLSVGGDATWPFLLIRDTPNASSWVIKTLFLQEIFSRGILTLGTFNVSYAHGDAEVDYLLSVLDEVFAVMAVALKTNGVRQILRCAPLEPLFKPR